MNKLIVASLMILLLLPAVSVFTPPVAFAEDIETGGESRGGSFPTIDSPDQVVSLANRITNWMFTIFLSLAVIMIIYAAFVYLTSGGGEGVGKAHKMLLYAVVAIAVAMLAKGVVNVVESLLTNL